LHYGSIFSDATVQEKGAPVHDVTLCQEDWYARDQVGHACNTPGHHQASIYKASMFRKVHHVRRLATLKKWDKGRTEEQSGMAIRAFRAFLERPNSNTKGQICWLEAPKEASRFKGE
jgi:hypothetical protein